MNMCLRDEGNAFGPRLAALRMQTLVAPGWQRVGHDGTGLAA
jgi:hypothetical protein